MDTFFAASLCRKSSTRHERSSTNKVLAWLNDNLSSVADTSCECCRSRRSCSFHASSCLAVRGKILEDRLLRLNARRRTIERKDDELEERRRLVGAMAKMVRNMSGPTLDEKPPCSNRETESDKPAQNQSRCVPTITEDDNEKKLLEAARDSNIPGKPVDLPLDDPSNKLTTVHSHNSRSGLHTIRAAFRKMTSLVKVKPATRTLTTQTTSSLMTMPLIESSSELETYYNKQGLKCTRC